MIIIIKRVIHITIAKRLQVHVSLKTKTAPCHQVLKTLKEILKNQTKYYKMSIKRNQVKSLQKVMNSED